jgi:hypothetical protein
MLHSVCVHAHTHCTTVSNTLNLLSVELFSVLYVSSFNPFCRHLISHNKLLTAALYTTGRLQVETALKEAQRRLEQHGLADRVRLFVQLKEFDYTQDLDDEVSMSQVRCSVQTEPTN